MYVQLYMDQKYNKQSNGTKTEKFPLSVGSRPEKM